jgi:diaminohydroxyphosphoribosylaminopyrimidine deaminase / 5-amino-6-(5-phosphoribosylamino)uracil reductase
LALSEQDCRYLERAMDLAERARGCTSPNPLVGAVIVSGDRIIGEGYHEGPWRDHAEIAAIKDALHRSGVGEEAMAEGYFPAEACRELCGGTTMFVTLEPCSTYGRTPPCAPALVAAGFARVVVGALDPTAAVDGRGVGHLREGGIQVDLAEGDLTRRVKRQNDAMRKVVSTGLPFVTYKYAMTLDGRVAADAGDSRWISSDESRALVHLWRSWSDAVLVGAGTAARDDPRLTARGVGCNRQPLRVVVGAGLGLRRDSALVGSLGEGPVLVICGPEVAAERRNEAESWGIETAVVPAGPDGGLDPRAVGLLLAARDVQAVLLEGGPRLAGAWWAAGLIDRVAAFVSPRMVPGVVDRSPLQCAGPHTIAEGTPLREVEVSQVGPDVLVSGYTREAF